MSFRIPLHLSTIYMLTSAIPVPYRLTYQKNGSHSAILIYKNKYFVCIGFSLYTISLHNISSWSRTTLQLQLVTCKNVYKMSSKWLLLLNFILCMQQPFFLQYISPLKWICDLKTFSCYMWKHKIGWKKTNRWTAMI